jgi:hypothetical protein
MVGVLESRKWYVYTQSLHDRLLDYAVFNILIFENVDMVLSYNVLVVPNTARTDVWIVEFIDPINPILLCIEPDCYSTITTTILL